MKIAVAGTGYVGLSLATLLSTKYEIEALDIIPEKVDMIPIKKNEVIVRMFPTEEDDSNKKEIGMGMICVNNTPNDIHVDYHDLFESIPE